MSILLQVILPVFLVIGFGYLAVWRKWFSDSGVEALMRFTQTFAIPCLLLGLLLWGNYRLLPWPVWRKVFVQPKLG